MVAQLRCALVVDGFGLLLQPLIANDANAGPSLHASLQPIAHGRIQDGKGGCGFGDERGARPGGSKFKLSGDFPTKISSSLLCTYSVESVHSQDWYSMTSRHLEKEGARIHDEG